MVITYHLWWVIDIRLGKGDVMPSHADCQQELALDLGVRAPAAIAAPPGRTVTDAATPALAAYDWLLVSSSAGKDSQASLDVTVAAARAAKCPRSRRRRACRPR